MDDLSNWYVRLSRARFWRSDDPADARAAFEALWYALVQALRCVAPVMPFLADEMWQNLVRGVCRGAPQGVHLAGYPEVREELRDPELLEAMESVQAVVELGRRSRDDARIKLRQPLRRGDRGDRRPRPPRPRRPATSSSSRPSSASRRCG